MIAYGERLGCWNASRTGSATSFRWPRPKRCWPPTSATTSLHLLAMPSMVACCFLDKSVLAAERVRGLARWSTPTSAASCSCAGARGSGRRGRAGDRRRWSTLGLLRRDDGNGQPCLLRPAPHTPEAIQLWILAQCSVQTLERFYMTAALLPSTAPARCGPGSWRTCAT
jgi:glycerol-3-phosphate O-acyltransferase